VVVLDDGRGPLLRGPISGTPWWLAVPTRKAYKELRATEDGRTLPFDLFYDGIIIPRCRGSGSICFRRYSEDGHPLSFKT